MLKARNKNGKLFLLLIINIIIYIIVSPKWIDNIFPGTLKLKSVGYMLGVLLYKEKKKRPLFCQNVLFYLICKDSSTSLWMFFIVSVIKSVVLPFVSTISLKNHMGGGILGKQTLAKMFFFSISGMAKAVKMKL